jgi:hypothetical protein
MDRSCQALPVTPTATSVAVGLVGAGIVAGTWASVMVTLVVPRRSRSRLNRVVDRSVDGIFRGLSKRTSTYEARDGRLAAQAPVMLIVQLGLWLLLFGGGFTLLLWAVDDHGIGHAAAQAGSSLFTLGYSAPEGTRTTVVDYLAAATGLVVVALQIGYLPTLYSAFNRRETEVTMLTGRAGLPAWGPEILARTRFGFAEGTEGARLGDLYLSWERWSADVAESHTNYPVLTRFRSPEPYSSWLVGLVAVLDSAALWLAFSPEKAPAVEARLCLRMGFTALRAIAASTGLPVDPDPDPDSDIQLTYDEFLFGVARMQTAGFAMERTPEKAWPHFRGWRVNYEDVAYRLAARLDAVPAQWTGSRRTSDLPMSPIRPRNRMPTTSD